MNSFMNTLRLLARSSLVEPETSLPDVPMTTFRDSSSSSRSSIASSDVDLERGGVWSSEFPSPSASPIHNSQLALASPTSSRYGS
ncbi:unnamed protein product [Rhizoctonia solani]|uniref:Uncharacterized protein n=1 Tax=Rhizoctonia solani TaxID=456999 RepID=A0A8H3BLR3_9AGAM|nr:unnamed protein product [Rhizoctonia solani]CAE6473530.1 unnamed protein product [Rhizoctonia solani]